jgi:hypothetical protein
MKKYTEFYVAIIAVLVWAAFYLASLFVGSETYPIGYFQKIPFGLMSMSVIYSTTFFILKYSQPFYYDLLDPDTQGGVQNISEWERIKIGLFWFAFFGLGAAFLAAMY